MWLTTEAETTKSSLQCAMLISITFDRDASHGGRWSKTSSEAVWNGFSTMHHTATYCVMPDLPVFGIEEERLY